MEDSGLLESVEVHDAEAGHIDTLEKGKSTAIKRKRVCSRGSRTICQTISTDCRCASS
jgi:hypothetical protein